MGLRINTNVQALNAQRNLRLNTLSIGKTFQRLSSGLRINQAADDAAGLAISEKIRSQLRGYDQAIRNAQDGISLIQTAEGAINETMNILQRIRELAIQAANDTNTHNDRQKIQEEIIQLRQELSRIAQTTEFNTRKLLDGSLSQTKQARAPQIDLAQNFRVGDTTATVSDIRDFIVNSSVNDQTSFANSSTAALTVSGFGGGVSGIDRTVADIDAAFQIRMVAISTTQNAGLAIGVQVFNSANGQLVTFTDNAGAAAPGFGAGSQTIALQSLQATAVTVGNSLQTMIDLNLNLNGVAFRMGQVTIDVANIALEDIGKVAVIQHTAQREAVTVDQQLTFHIGPNSGQLIRVGVDELTARSLRMEDVQVVSTLDPRTNRNADEADVMLAEEAIGIVDDAIDQVNALRAKLGAVQNRLESTIRSMEITHENLSASESRIRDADVAKETAALTKGQILIQAGTAVLAQANVQPQSALALLQ